jgi:4-amino-4-deoxychorismate lyase
MESSATRLGIALPARTRLAALAAEVVTAWPAGVEGALRIVCTRGAEGGGTPTVYATLSPIKANVQALRRDGITVATASIGVDADARTRLPWLLAGAKTLSYAVNMASQRWATEQGTDDVLWVSGDGFALEGPTSSLVWLAEDTIWTVPAATTGILAGVTAAFLLHHASDLGFGAGERMITPDQLLAVDGAWLTSSVRGLAEIRAIDGVTRKPSDQTARVLDLLGFTPAG